MFDEMKATKSLLPKIEEEWCSFHKLVQSSLNRVSEICMYSFIFYQHINSCIALCNWSMEFYDGISSLPVSELTISKLFFKFYDLAFQMKIY